MVGKFIFGGDVRWVGLFIAAGLLAGVLAVATAPPAQAQTESTTTITGGQGVVSVVSAPSRDIRNGSGEPPRARPGVWPYTCSFYFDTTLESLANSTTNPIPGNFYNLVCLARPGTGATNILNPVYQYNPGASVDPTQPDLVTSIEIREVAQNALNPTDLPPAFSPADQQITGIETWLWPEGDTASTMVWATAGGLTVTIESRYRETRFVMSGANEGSVTCDNAPLWAPGAIDSPCTFTFLREGVQTIEATSTWDLFWWDNAASPTPQPLGTITETFDDVVEVVDLEAVISRN